MTTAALLTILAETGLFALCGHRRPVFLLYCALVNLLTNITLNLLIALLLWRGGPALAHALAGPLEGCVVAAEYWFFRQALSPGRRLLALTLCANLLSYSLGVLLLGPF